jgi:hypothetical protein
MQKIFFLMGVAALLTTTGCIFAPSVGGGRERHDEPRAVIVGPPVVRVEGPPPPEVIVRP